MADSNRCYVFGDVRLRNCKGSIRHTLAIFTFQHFRQVQLQILLPREFQEDLTLLRDHFSRFSLVPISNENGHFSTVYLY